MGILMDSVILVVEDHKETCAVLKAALEEEGLEVQCAGTVKAGKAFLGRQKPRLIVLDLLLPDGNGLELCGWARRNKELCNIPVIALTGQDELNDKKRGFDAGVDQYLTKPIVIDEFVMWVKALLKRVEMDTRSGKILTLSGLHMDVPAHIVKYNGHIVENLTRREFSLLYVLAKNSPRTMSRRAILSEAWKTVSVENLVDTHLFNLKRKLPVALAEKIQSIAGKGFRYYDVL